MSFAALARWWAGVFALALPWLVAPMSGPSPAIVPSLLAWAALGVGAVFCLSNENRVSSLAVAWLIAAMISSMFGLCQYFGFAENFPWISEARVGEAYANLRQRNQFSTLCNIGLAVLLWRAAVWPRATRRAMGLMVLAALLLVTASAASGSRTGLVQLLFLFAMFVGWLGFSMAQRDPILFTAAIGYGLAALTFGMLGAWQHAGGGIWSRVQETAPACSSRLVLWSNVLHLIQLKPLAGWGWGELSFAHFSTLYPSERFCDILDNAHNLPLHLAVELGLPVAVTVCGVVLWWIARHRPWSETDPMRRMAWAVLALLSLHSLLEYPLWYGPFQLTLVACLWMLWRRPTQETPSIEVPSEVVALNWQACTAALLIASSGWGGWSYWRVSQLYLPPEARAPAYREDTLRKVQGSWLFQNQVKFAALTTTPLTRDNAVQQHTMALELLHFSPEPSVVQRAIESAVMLGRDDEALYYLQRFKAAFPQAHAQWAAQ